MADKRSLNLAKSRDDNKQWTTTTKNPRDSKKDLLQPQNGKRRSPHVRKRKRRFDPTEKLPTPPPDPHDMEKTTGERSPKRKSLEEDKENKDTHQEDTQSSSSRRVSADVTSPSALEFATAFSGTEEAFQHLEKLHSLMEQILDLREKNTRLFRRVRELERFKALRKLEARTRRTFLVGNIEPLLPEEDIGFAESLLYAMLESSTPLSSSQSTAAPTTPNQEVTRNRSFRAPMTRQRSRSIGNDARSTVLPNSAKRSSCHLQYNNLGGGSFPLSKSSKRNSITGSFGIAPPKVSKWTKVKAAFKWERAGTGTGGSNNALSNVVMEALEHDPARFLRLPEGPDAPNTTPSGSSTRIAEHSGPPSPGTLSSSSSTDDVYNNLYKRTHGAKTAARETEDDPTRRSTSLEGEPIIPHNIQYATHHTRDGVSRRLEKGHKTPWGMVKDIIQSRRENVRRPQPRGSLRSEDGYSLSSLESSDMLHEVFTQEQSAKPRVQITVSEGSLAVPFPKPSSPANSSEVVDLASRRLTPTLTITVPSSEELRSVSSPESVSPPTSHHQLDSNSTDERSPSEDPDFASSPNCRNSTVTSLRERRRSANASAITTGLAGDRNAALPRLQRQDSKWNKVKRAFLSGASSVPPSPSRMSSFFDETDGGGSYSASAEDLDNNGGVSPTVQADIQRNYQILHDKLSVEFYRKLTEWEKLKNGQSSGGNTEVLRGSRTASSPKDKDFANVLLMGEEQLTPEFKKKLQEWNRIKKGNPSGTTSPEHQVFRRRLTDWQIWRTPTKNEGKATDADSSKAHLSEDFLKKMEEWKKIKSARSDEEQSASGRRDSGEMIYQPRNYIDPKWKTIDEKEFQPLDKVIAMIEREQHRVEKQREKLLEKSPRQSDLSRVVDSTPDKREVLVHTSTGFYRFEGISQEFTRKLYEWEKSQGIAPEYSTFQLLNPAYRIFADDKNVEKTHEKGSRILKRSKSMSSVVESNLRDETPLRQPSSLSLNDVTNLENEAKRMDSKQTIGEEEMSEELTLDDSEPEAVIVDIEDVIEETASPMAKFQPQQTPVYCVTASETTSIAIPLGTVTASHEPSPVILIQPGETHHRVRKHCRFPQFYDERGQVQGILDKNPVSIQSTSQIDTFESNDISNDENRKRLYEPSDISICETIIEEDVSTSHIGEESNSVSNVANTADNARVQSCEEIKLHENIACNLVDSKNESKKIEDISIGIEMDQTNQCVTEYSGSLNDAAQKTFKTLLTQKDDIIQDVENTNENDQENNDGTLQNCPRELSNDGDIHEVVITVNSDNIRQKKVLKTRRLTDTQVGYKWRQPQQNIEETSPESADCLTVSTYPETPSVERIIINESTLNKIVVPTASNEQISNIPVMNEALKSRSNDNLTNVEDSYCRRLTSKSESKSVFVKTKRIIFSPFSRRNSKDKTALFTLQKDEFESSESKKESSEVTSTTSKCSASSTCVAHKFSDIQRSKSSSECPATYEKLPPLPQSPILSRKEYRRSSPKETAPSIRMMIQRYNQKLQEDAGSPASSGSGSPIWRSPTSERRVRTQMEKYQEEVRRAIAGSSKNDLEDEKKPLEKSASAGIIQPSSASVSTKNVRGEILKSTSADFVRNPDFVKQDSGKSAIDALSYAKRKFENNEHNGGALVERRKNSLQNMNPEIFTNVKQSLIQEFKTLPMKSEGIEDRISRSSWRENDFGEHHTTYTYTNESSNALKMRQSPMAMGKISPELIHKLNALSNVATQKPGRYCTNPENYDSQLTTSANSTPLRVRAQRIKKAKDDFFSRGPSCYSHDPSIESYRHSQNSNTSMDLSNQSDFVKSASAGMINVDPRTYERLATSRTGDSLPRVEKTCVEVAGTLSKIASKFRRAKLKRGKDKDKEGKMSTVSMLCRQSLLVDIQAEEMSKSCPTSPSPQRDEDDHLRFKQHRDSN